MDKKIKKFNVVPSTSDVYAVSLVDAPAVESTFIALSSHKKQPVNFKIQNAEKRMVYGVALRADFDIYRCYGEEEFYINFDKDAVRRLMTKFMKNHAQNNFTIDHMDFANGLTVVESWIVDNVENDKANALGLENFSEGSWIIGVKVDDDETWTSIKEGRWTGFSVEAFCDLEEITKEIKNNKHNSDKIMAKKSVKMDEILENIKNIISDAISDAEGKDTETQEEVVETAAEEVVEAVDANEETTEETTVEAAEESTPEEQIAEDVIEQVEENAEDTETAAEDLQAVVDQLQQEVDDLKKENEELKKKNQKMSKKPSVNPKNVTGKEQKFSAIDQLSQMGFIKW